MKVGERWGVQYRFSSPVSSVKLSADGRTAEGITLESGETLAADIVVCNADLVYAYNNLLPPTSYAKRLEKREGSCSSISFYWAMDRVIPELNAHNIFLADEYRESFDMIFKNHSLPKQPSFYVNVPSRVDPSAAPTGKDTIVVLCPVGHLDETENGDGLNASSAKKWDALVARARKAVIETIESRVGVNISSHIIHESINTPQLWKERFNLDKGAILGLSHSFFNVLAFRPSTKHANIKNLYFVGASTHPGTGVPIVLAGSKITGEQILSDRGIERPWGDGLSLLRQKQFKQRGALDVLHPPRTYSFAVKLLYGLAVILACVLLPQLVRRFSALID